MNPIQIVFRGMTPSEAVQQRIWERAERLGAIDQRFTSLHVVVQAPHQRQRQGNLFDVRLRARYPGGEIDISCETGRSPAHEDVYVAIADSFDAAERQLASKLRKQDHGRSAHQRSER